MALVDVIETGIYLSKLLKQICKVNTQIPIKCFVDNKSLVEAIYSTNSVNDKSIRINISFIKEALEFKEIDDVFWLRSIK